MPDQYTRGPWLAIDVRGIKDDGPCFAIVARDQPLTRIDIKDIAAVWSRGGTKRAEANARLIAEAPDLLKWARWAVNSMRRDFPESPVFSSWQFEQMVAAVDRASGQKTAGE